MSSFKSAIDQNRQIVLPEVRDVFARVYVTSCPAGAIPMQVEGSKDALEIYCLPEATGNPELNHAYNFPFLFLADGTPWLEANSFMLSLIENAHPSDRPTDKVRRTASELLEYIQFCESNSIDWKDFSGMRPSHRPTYRYFNHLKTSSNRTSRVNNRYTGAVYEFYNFVSKNWFYIDMERVDSVEEYTSWIQTARGSMSITRKKRSQTQKFNSTSLPDLNFVRDEGEDLRPLYGKEYIEFTKIINEGGWSVQDKLIIDTAMMSGARKQTVLTLRKKHIEKLASTKLTSHGYPIRVGPGTAVDTKSGKNQTIYIPEELAERLLVWISSEAYAVRFSKFHSTRTSSVDKATLSSEDTYIFLSDQGNSYYMAKNDPLYPYVKSPPIGQVTQTITRKLLKNASIISKDFTFHWLRATFAFQLFKALQNGELREKLNNIDEVGYIQWRLSHEHRETTENYLKLFKQIDEVLQAQEGWEAWLFTGRGI